MSARRDSIIYLTVLHNNVGFLFTLVFTYKAQAGALADDNGKDSSCDALDGDQRLIKQLVKVRNTKCIIAYFVFILKSTVLFFYHCTQPVRSSQAGQISRMCACASGTKPNVKQPHHDLYGL